MHGFDTFQCLTCGKITSLAGEKLLPDSMVFDPNHTDSIAQFGWPFDDQTATIERGKVICATQWGTPIQPSGEQIMSDVPSEPTPEPAPEPTPEAEPVVEPETAPEEVPV